MNQTIEVATTKELREALKANAAQILITDPDLGAAVRVLMGISNETIAFIAGASISAIAISLIPASALGVGAVATGAAATGAAAGNVSFAVRMLQSAPVVNSFSFLQTLASPPVVKLILCLATGAGLWVFTVKSNYEIEMEAEGDAGGGATGAPNGKFSLKLKKSGK